MLWWPQPEAGDIVWCSFPLNKGIAPGPKPRPALVVKLFDDFAPQWFAKIAYGTSQKTGQLRSGEFVITPDDSAAFRLSGLTYATKFCFPQMLELPFNEQWFKPPPGAPHGQLPKLGMLHPNVMRRAQAAWHAAGAT
jgi:hypothetical protein